ncbi:MAG: hypothetical protein R2780_05465 [Crocinitomicaceae bacterium]
MNMFRYDRSGASEKDMNKLIPIKWKTSKINGKYLIALSMFFD